MQDGFSAQLSDQLTKKLQARGDLVIEARASGSTQIEALLRETTANYGELDGIVHLAGILAEPDGALADAADKVFERQLARCATAADIFQACASTQTNTTCWLITANAAGSLLPSPRRDARGEPRRGQRAVGIWPDDAQRDRPLCHPPD
jgi:phthiocerol/phenolphthiocerol synthesis type-I polyketide synthase C